MDKILLFLVIVTAFVGCDSNPIRSTEDVDPEFGNLPTALIDSIKLIANGPQSFRIDPGKNNSILGERGTLLIVPRNSIVDQQGNNVAGMITVQLKENFSVFDYTLSNLQTVHNGALLETEGMIYFTAEDQNGNQLSISEGNSIRIQIPRSDSALIPNIFLGNRTSDGTMNWDEIRDPAKSLVPYPIMFISKNRFLMECCDHYGITTDTVDNKCIIHYGNLGDFENTLLATNEFKLRYQSMCWDSIINYYINNLDKNLWEIDEMVVKYLIKDSTERVNYYLNNVPSGVNGNPRTQQQKDAHEWLINNAKEHGHIYIEWMKNLAALKLTKVDTTKLIDSAIVENLNRAFISYDAIKFGWVNVDFFYEDPKAVPMKLVAKTNQTSPLINLIIEGRGVILTGSEHAVNEYWFTKNEDGYNKLPKGERATIIAIGLDNHGLLYGEKSIVLGEEETVNVALTSITGAEMSKRLQKYGSQQ